MMVSDLTIRLILKRKIEALRIGYPIASIVAIILMFSGLIFTHHVGSMDIPMLTVGGKEIPNDRLHCFAPIDNAKLQRLTEKWKEKARIWPFSYINLQYSYVTEALDSLYLSILVVPDEFFNTHVAASVTNGDLPSRSQPECVMGADAAQAWGFKVNQYIQLEIGKKLKFEKINYRQPEEKSLKVVGVMSEDMNYQFLRGAIIITKSTYEALYKKSPIYNSFFAYPSGIMSSTKELERDANSEGLNVIICRYPFLRAGGIVGILIMAFFAAGMILQTSSSSILERNLKMVGILRSLGLGHWRLISIFAFADLSIQLLGGIIGMLLAKYGFLIMNLAVMRNGPMIFSSYSTHYRFHWPSLAILTIVLVFSATIRMGRTLRFLSRNSSAILIQKAA